MKFLCFSTFAESHICAFLKHVWRLQGSRIIAISDMAHECSSLHQNKEFIPDIYPPFHKRK